jgi:L-asparaginase
MKKILLIHTGGTFGMVPLEPTKTLAPGNLQEQILYNVPEIKEIADIEVEVPFNVDSSDIALIHWNRLADIINRKMDNYDGFVIIHGTDTMAYTAAALSYTLLNLKKPVILTGAQRPLAKLRTDARSNLINSVELATMEINEVVIVFGQRILRGNRTIKISNRSYDAFNSPNYSLLGNIGLDIRLDRKYLLKGNLKYHYNQGFSDAVVVIYIHPALNPEHFFPLVMGEANAFIFIGYGAGNIPSEEPDWLPLIDRAIKAGKAVFIGSHSIYGAINLDLYESGKKALDLGVSNIGDMTTEAAYVKLMKILAQTSDIDNIYKKFNSSCAGEIGSL